MKVITKIQYDDARDYIEHVFGVDLSDMPSKEIFWPVTGDTVRKRRGEEIVFVKMMSDGGKYDNAIAERIAESWKKKNRWFHWNSADKGPKRRSFYVEDKWLPKEGSFTIKQPKVAYDGPGVRQKRRA